MICVIATVKVKPGKRTEFLDIFNANVPAVKKENGCIEYTPMTDVDTGLGNQLKDENELLVVEKWASVDALHAHLKTPHMVDFREKTKDIVEELSLRVLQ